VVNAAGKISLRRIPGAELTQRMLLEREGIRFGAGGKIAWGRFGWKVGTAS
jgi:alkylated DNA nucleotide flippase Atl1